MGAVWTNYGREFLVGRRPAWRSLAVVVRLGRPDLVRRGRGRLRRLMRAPIARRLRVRFTVIIVITIQGANHVRDVVARVGYGELGGMAATVGETTARVAGSRSGLHMAKTVSSRPGRATTGRRETGLFGPFCISRARPSKASFSSRASYRRPGSSFAASESTCPRRLVEQIRTIIENRRLRLGVPWSD